MKFTREKSSQDHRLKPFVNHSGPLIPTIVALCSDPIRRHGMTSTGDKRMNMMSSMATPAKHLTVFEEDALALTQAALEISRAYESKDERRLAAALDRNLKLWVGIRTLVSSAENPLPMQIKDNLIRLSSFVAQKTFEMQNGANAKTIESLANTNLQISEGLLDKRSH